MQNFGFLLTNTQNPTSSLFGFGLVILLMVGMLWFSSKNRKKQEQQEALTAFDKAATTLLTMGFTPGQLAERLTQGGSRDA